MLEDRRSGNDVVVVVFVGDASIFRQDVLSFYSEVKQLLKCESKQGDWGAAEDIVLQSQS